MEIRRVWLAAVCTVAMFTIVAASFVEKSAAFAASARGRIFVLMVWDGLRPDFVDAVNTPNLFALENSGVRFARHHSIYPTLTMVDAAGLATGASPSRSGIYGDMMYLPPVLDMARAATIPNLGVLLGDPLNLEHSQYLAGLNDPRALDGHLMGLRTTVKEVERAGGFVGVFGKQGPTLLFDDEFAQPEINEKAPHNFMFVADDMAAPATMAAEFARMPTMARNDFAWIITRDAWFTKLAAEQALPAAKLASANGKPAMVVLWQHNPDITQHIAGLGTQPALDALHACDANLATVRAAITALGIADRTDLVVVSDHGFATIKATVPVARLLVAAGLKKELHSREIVVAADGGGDWIYVSKKDFPTAAARRQIMQRIVEYVEAQEWAGPIFSAGPLVVRRRGSSSDRDKSDYLGESDYLGKSDYLGSIAGTFNQSAFGLGDNPRAADLIISFRELPDADNLNLTGAQNPAADIGPNGPETVTNKSSALVHPVPGVIYSDADHFTTGMGMHGTAGARELHNFCAATGPDFRRGLVDNAPTGNADIAPTVGVILGRAPTGGATGRILREALSSSGPKRSSQPEPVTAATTLTLKNSRITTTVQLTRYAGHEYLDGSQVESLPLK
jgi:arylsulfatase A-like enzyme